MSDTPPFRRDKYGNALDAYPATSDHGQLLGINVSGNAVYVTDDTATLAVLAVDGSLQVPPLERGFPAELPLEEVGLTPGEYIFYVADETEPWRSLSEFGNQAAAETGHDIEQAVRDDPTDADLEDLIATLSAGPTEEVDGEASGRIRRVAMDQPEAVVTSLDQLFELLTDQFAGASTTESDDLTWDRAAVSADLAFAIARAAREDPAAVADHLDDLIVVLGGERTPADQPIAHHLTDALDILGRHLTRDIAAALVRAIETDDETAVSALNSLYRLEHRYSDGDHPLCDDESLRAAVDDALDRGGAVAEAAMDVDMIHGFHGGL